MRKIAFYAVLLLTLGVWRMDPFFGGLVLAGGIAERMVAKETNIW